MPSPRQVRYCTLLNTRGATTEYIWSRLPSAGRLPVAASFVPRMAARTGKPSSLSRSAPSHAIGGLALATLGLSNVWVATPDGGQHCAVFRSSDAGARWHLFFRTIASQACGTEQSLLPVRQPQPGMVNGDLLRSGRSHRAHSLPHEEAAPTGKLVESNLPRRQTRNNIPDCDFEANVIFRNSVDGWATGQCGPAPQVESLYRTSNGGQTWRHQRLPRTSRLAYL